MIEVPRRSPELLPSAPLPGPRLSPEAPTSAFQPPAPVDLSGVTRGVGQIVQEERNKADQLAVLDADNQLAQLQTDLGTKATSLHGKDALGAQSDLSDQWKQGVDKIRSNLTNDRQQFAFDNRVGARYSSLYETVARHTQAEVKSYDDQTTQAALDNRLNDAVSNYQDPAQLQQALGETKAIIADYGRRNGWSSDVIQEKTADRVSKLHADVIERMLANDQDTAASQYYASVKDQIAGADAGPIEKSLEEGSVRGESQRQADQITSQFTDRKPALEEARKITDPKVRDSTVERVNQFFNEQNAADRETGEKNMVTAANIVDQSGTIFRIPPDLWNTFSLGERASLKEYAKQKSKGDPIATDWGTYYNLMSVASSDATRDRFLRTNLFQYRGQLADTEFKQVVELQASLRKGDQNAEATLGGIRTTNQVVSDGLNAVGIDPTPKPGSDDAERGALFRRRVDQAAAQLEVQTKKKPTATDIQGIVDNLLVKGVTSEGGFLGWLGFKKDEYQFERTPDEDAFVIDVKDVPQAERSQIEDALRRRNLPVTDASVLRIFQQSLSRSVSGGH